MRYSAVLGLSICFLDFWVMAFTPLRSKANEIVFAEQDSNACKLPLIERYGLSPGFGSRDECANSVGTLNALMLFVDFSDNIANDTTQSLYDFFVPRASAWYLDSSYGKLKMNVTADFSRFYRMPKPSSSYNWTRGLTSERHEAYIRDALDSYLKSSNQSSFNFVDVLYIVPTASVVNPSFSPTFMSEVRTASGLRVSKTAVTLGADAFKKWKYKVINHETGHTLCLPDLYKENAAGPSVHEYVGGFDLMGLISGVDPDYFAYHKWKLGWLADSQVDCITEAGKTTHTLSAIEVSENDTMTKAVVVKRNSTSVLVAEVRSKQGNDERACAEGVLLYTISTATATGQIRVIDTTPNSGGCGDEMEKKEQFNELNDAPLSVGKFFAVPGWNVVVNVTQRSGSTYTFTIDYS